MEHIEQCLEELQKLKKAFAEKESEIAMLKGQQSATSVLESSELAMVRENLRKVQSENKALVKSLKLISEKRKQDRATIEKWQQAMKPLQNSQVGHEGKSEIPTDETRLESSPPHKDATSLFMESIEEVVKQEEFTSEEPSVVEEVDEPVAKKQKYSMTIDDLLKQDWHPGDFMINPQLNSGITHAFHEKTLGKAREHLDCRDCVDCSKFQNLTGKKLESRHRENWEKQNTPPGFWRSGFDTAAESLDRHQAAEKVREEAIERLKYAINSGKYLFKDPQLREMASRGEIR